MSNLDHQSQSQSQTPYHSLKYDLLPPNYPHTPLLLPLFGPSHKPSSLLRHQISTLQIHPVIESLLHMLNHDLSSAHFLLRHMQGTPKTCSEAMYVHGILHRVEGDLDNARAWYGDVCGEEVFRVVWDDPKMTVPIGDEGELGMGMGTRERRRQQQPDGEGEQQPEGEGEQQPEGEGEQQPEGEGEQQPEGQRGQFANRNEKNERRKGAENVNEGPKRDGTEEQKNDGHDHHDTHNQEEKEKENETQIKDPTTDIGHDDPRDNHRDHDLDHVNNNLDHHHDPDSDPDPGPANGSDPDIPLQRAKARARARAFSFLNLVETHKSSLLGKSHNKSKVNNKEGGKKEISKTPLSQLVTDISIQEILRFLDFCERKFGTEPLLDASHVWVSMADKHKDKAADMITGGEGWREF
ncbi:hypothetical protein HRR83_002943 [Exophiala dermatitidis]|uniref:Uncharacterized protein n=1 Tax=Exophiala dermatitidis TaxID=5970 RepID=A0AAN6IRE4_EXODE|nr:hypothetical protein HRR73_008051 [Exophiala dermatitidis]KAJ4537731.1 hypothetical protein HRR76_005720 [Exophiala dermatitidis]KAJ4551606.1 hypothetical protein HRR77_002839 [Exophiala dermatitidis]KAJ4569340.1 hypothetical protein HRR79_004193 [Exophiala dermatitidis]KAJ4572847.1 hypothetical protein HRR81_005290 [Exophiala dermatitidis]